MDQIYTTDHKRPQQGVAQDWPLYAGLWGAVGIALLLAFRHDVMHMLGLWWRTESYSHCLLIPFILLWLVWQRRHELARLQPKAQPLFLFPILGCLLLWLIGEMGNMAIIRHMALVMILITTVPLMLGWTVARALAFPLFFSIFMIPAGEELIPYLQNVTAAFSIWMLEVLRVPAYQNGVLISIPQGDFEVAQACSGIRFLIAMLVFSTLVAYLGFQSWQRRLLFVALALVMAVLANGLRAGGTIYLAHLTSAAVARGVDHIIFGWVFFAIILIFLLAVAYRFFDRPVDAKAFDPEKLQPCRPTQQSKPLLWTITSLILALIAFTPLYGQMLSVRSAQPATQSLILPQVRGWQKLPWQGQNWWPHYRGATAEAGASYVDQESGARVEVYMAVYDRQEDGAELLAFGQGVIAPDSPWSWVRDVPAPAHARAAFIGTGTDLREVWQYYLVDGALRQGRLAIKSHGLKAQLGNGDMRVATLVISAERLDLTTSARPAMQNLVRGMGPVDQFMRAAVRTSDFEKHADLPDKERP